MYSQHTMMGFKPTTFRLRVSSYYHQTKIPTCLSFYLINNQFTSATSRFTLMGHLRQLFRYFPEGPSVTRLGDILHFGILFKAWGKNYLAQTAHILVNFCKVLNIFLFLLKSFLGNFYRNLATFYWSHCQRREASFFFPPPPRLALI